VRKDAERLYAVLWSRWFITKSPARYMTLPRLINTAKAVAILHNMAVEHRRHGFTASTRMAAAAAVRGARSGRHDCDDQGASGDGTAFVKDDEPTCGSVWGAPVPDSDGRGNDRRGCEGAPMGTERYMQMPKKEVKDTQEHFSLLHDLAEHVWADRGSLLAPYLRLPDVGGLSEGSSRAEDVLR